MADAPQLVVIGAPDDRRIQLLQTALQQLGLPPAVLIAWADLLEGRRSLAEAVKPGAIVRIESPGKSAELERALIAAGADAPDDGLYDRIDRDAARALNLERGRLRYMRQWYLGLCSALQRIEAQLAACPPHLLMNRPQDIALMCDKRRCHAHLLQHGIPVPPSLAPIESYEALLTAMRDAGWSRVFIKPAHGSSAAGVVAFALSGERCQAISTVELVEQGGEVRLYNTRRLRTYRTPHEIATLIDALCRQRVHVERWLPKAGHAGQTFDLRVVAIAGRARHVAVRQSRSPITNLHLLNTRGDPAAVRERMGEHAWSRAMQTCEQTLACFEGSLYAGIDLLISPDFRRHAVLEVNAFGDLLPNILHDGVDTYTAEIEAALATAAARSW